MLPCLSHELPIAAPMYTAVYLYDKPGWTPAGICLGQRLELIICYRARALHYMLFSTCRTASHAVHMYLCLQFAQHAVQYVQNCISRRSHEFMPSVLIAGCSVRAELHLTRFTSTACLQYSLQAVRSSHVLSSVRSSHCLQCALQAVRSLHLLMPDIKHML